MNVFKKHSTPSLLATFLPTSLNIDRYTTLIIFSLGLIVNILTIIVWWYPRLRLMESTVLTLLLISILDVLQLMIAMIIDMQRVWSVSVFFQNSLCQMFQVLANGASILSTLLILLSSVQHYMTLKKNPNYQYYKSKKWTYLIVSILAILSITVSIPEGYFSFLDLAIYHLNECTLPRSIQTIAGYKVYHWLVKFLLPSGLIVVISVVSIVILHRQSSQSNELDYFHQTDCTILERKYCGCKRSMRGEKVSSLTKVVVIIGFYEVFTSIPRLIMKSFEPLNSHGEVRMADFEVKEDPIWERYFNIEGANIIFNEIHLSIHSFKFFVYFAFNKDFRQCFGDIFGLKIFRDKPKSRRKVNPQKHNSEVQKSNDKGQHKPTSYYIDRATAKQPFKFVKPHNSTHSTARTKQTNPIELKRGTHKNSNGSINRERSKSGDHNPLSTDHIYYSVPRTYCCSKHHQKYVLSQKRKNFTERRQHPKPVSTKFHNVCSEFEYESLNSSDSSEASSAIMYLEKCLCSEYEYESDDQPVLHKKKKKAKKFHNI